MFQFVPGKSEASGVAAHLPLFPGSGLRSEKVWACLKPPHWNLLDTTGIYVSCDLGWEH